MSGESYIDKSPKFEKKKKTWFFKYVEKEHIVFKKKKYQSEYII